MWLSPGIPESVRIQVKRQEPADLAEMMDQSLVFGR
jgi:hypothetical protein